MKLALLELRRRPGRFAVAGAALVFLVLLMLFLGKLLDGLFFNSTGAIRVHEADRFVYSADARESILRSSLDEGDLAEIAAVDGVAEVHGFGISLLGLAVPGDDEVFDGAIGGYEAAGGRLPAPPAPGEGLADEALKDRGVAVGDTLLVGPAAVAVTVVGWVEDSNYLQQNGLWVEPGTWRDIQNRNRPDAVVRPDEWQVAIVRLASGVDGAAVSDEIAAVTGGDVLDEHDATFAIPGVPEQDATLSAVIYATAFVVALVVGLFFALLTLERRGQYAVLKAMGAPDRMLVVGLVVQAVVVAAGAYVIGGLLSWLLGLVIPPEVPLYYRPERAAFVLVAVLAAAVLGGLVSLRRVIRIDPASAIGAGL